MRLLRLEDDGEFSLVDFIGSKVPRYAILSHTWGPDGHEVIFGDMVKGVGKYKPGYSKIRFCGEQASKDGLQYFWVDTCCIDKSSSAELSEAINSMFRWYFEAARCYVYLSDVSVGGSIRSDTSFQLTSPFRHTWKAAFQKSRWFTRRWTLQELIAPASVQFFSVEWELLGDKKSLVQIIHDTTRIPIPALRGMSLSAFSVEERMSWAAERYTIREEDAAYSLLGIFDIQIPLLYGEGRERALKRLLKEIREAGGNNWNTSQYEEWSKIPGLMLNLHEEREDLPTDMRLSTTSPNPVQTTGIREICRTLLSQEDLRALYTIAVRNVERRKAHAHIRGFLKDYGQNLLMEALSKSLEAQAAKFVQGLAGPIADEIRWSITSFENVGQSPETELTMKHLENLLCSLQRRGALTEEEHKSPGLTTNADVMFEEDEIIEEFDSDLILPNTDEVKSFLLDSEAFGTHMTAIRTWLKHDGGHSRDIEKQAGSISVHTDTEEVTEESLTESVASGPGQRQIEFSWNPPPEFNSNPPIDTAREPKSISKLRHNGDSVADLISGLLNFWGISFFLYDLVELLIPHVQPGWKRLRWRCSCNTVLWGDFLADDDSALDQLKGELLWWRVPFIQQAPSRGVSMSQSSADSDTNGPGAIYSLAMHSAEPSSKLRGVKFAHVSGPNLNVSDPAPSVAAHIVDVPFSPRYFEVCISVGNYAMDHHEIDISRVTSDGELFELIWDRYSSSRGNGLRRLFLRPWNVHFVMFSVNRHYPYGAGIHLKPDEFPPQNELDEKRYHYLCPKIRMPVNVFLHYLHRARWNIWGEHTEDTWLQRLPKKLKDSVLAEIRQNDATNQQNQQEAIKDPNLAFGWGVQILHGPNHAVLGALLIIGIAVTFIVSGMVRGFGKTQEQGFGTGNFLLAILASTMTAVYFQLQDQ